MPDNLAITTHEELGTEDRFIAPTRSSLGGKSVPGGYAGYVPQDRGWALCPECVDADEQIREELESDEGGIVYGNSESDYPGMSCEGCERYLDTRLIVYKNQDPVTFWRIEQSESLGMYHEVAQVEEICNHLGVRAYELGWNEPNSMSEGMYGPGGEFEGETPELPTDSARYANHTAPKLRALAGMHDSGYGTYTESYCNIIDDVLQFDIHPAFRAGYADRLEGKEYRPDEREW